MKEFGKRLKDLRQEKNLSLIKMSKDTNISIAAISRWENDKAEILAPELIILAKYFGVTTDYLLGLEN